MKRLVIASLFTIAWIGAQAQTFIDHARVRSVEPKVENISVPRNECHTQWIQDERRSAGPERQYGGTIVGALAGGVLGHQVGQGSGKDAATALGVVLGAVAGDRLGNRDQRLPDESAQRQVQRCHTVYDAQTRVTGYLVGYEYRGQQYSTVMRNNPGNSLQVQVSVTPIEH